MITSKAQTSLSDNKLFDLCKKYGDQALAARRKFLGLLPEVSRRRLYEKKGFCSIFEFAAKLAGVSHEQVRNVLNLNRQFEEKPLLQTLLTSGQVSVNKLIRIASISTKDNQMELAEKVKLLPQKAVEVMVRDYKAVIATTIMPQDANNETPVAAKYKAPPAAVNGTPAETPAPAPKNTNGLRKALFAPDELRAQPAGTNISRDVQLMKLLSEDIKAELIKLADKKIDINGIIAAALQKRELEIAREKEKIANENASTAGTKNVSRHIPVKIKKLLLKEYGKKCAIPDCRHDAETIHHAAHFAISRSHDPRFLAPLCSGHHLLAHAADLRFWEKRRS